MADLHHDLRETLLRAGLSPRHSERYLRELREHRDDIAEHLQVTGLSAKAARRQAEHPPWRPQRAAAPHAGGSSLP